MSTSLASLSAPASAISQPIIPAMRAVPTSIVMLIGFCHHDRTTTSPSSSPPSLSSSTSSSSEGRESVVTTAVCRQFAPGVRPTTMQPLMVTTLVAAAGDLVGDWSWTVWLLIPLALVLALVTALVVGPLGEPPRRAGGHGVSASLERRAAEEGTCRAADEDWSGWPRPCCSLRRVARRPASRGPATNRLGRRPSPRRRRPRRHRFGGPHDRIDGVGRDHGVHHAEHQERPRFDSGTGHDRRRRPPRRRPVRARTRRHGRVADDEVVIGIRARHRRVAHSPDELRHRQGHLLGLPRRERPTDSRPEGPGRVPRRRVQAWRAVQVCRQMVEEEGAFLLVGGGGADQITACAQYANENGIPYLSAGVNESGLSDLDTYFRRRSRMPSRRRSSWRSCRSGGSPRWGSSSATRRRSTTPSRPWAAADTGVTIAYETRINKTAAEPEQLSVVQELKNSGVEAVILLSSPVVFIGLANQGVNQSYTPTWIGPGITRGSTRSPTSAVPPSTPACSSRRPRPRRHRPAGPRLQPGLRPVRRGRAGDDIGMQLWSLNKAIALMLEATGPELGRAAFMNTLVTTPEFDNGIYAGLVHGRRPLRRHGAHLLDADCGSKQFTTAEQFISVS